jgi:DNA-binding GntR family transcriptional regulator
LDYLTTKYKKAPNPLGFRTKPLECRLYFAKDGSAMSVQKKRSGAATPSKLQRQLALKIVEYIRDNGLRKGAPLTEIVLAEALQVSRTPVRAALKYLVDQDIVAASPTGRGVSVKSPVTAPAKLARFDTPTDEEALYLKVAENYVSGRLPENLSEADLMREYGISRGLLVRVLQRMAKEGVIERNPGYGWRFAPLLRTGAAHDQSYRFRMAVEPAALLEPSFTLDREWATRCRQEHEAVIAARPERISMIKLFEMNADFHEMLAVCSGNHFFHQTVQSQNKLRRFINYSWTYGLERIAASCQEHLAILTAVENGEREWAANLMRRHLVLASTLKPAESPEAI